VVMESHSCYVPFFVMFPHHNCKPYANIFDSQNFLALFSALFNLILNRMFQQTVMKY